MAQFFVLWDIFFLIFEPLLFAREGVGDEFLLFAKINHRPLLSKEGDTGGG